VKLSVGEETLVLHLRAYDIPFEREVAFDPKRRWRVDFMLAGKLAVEVEGGAWSNGRHVRGSGFLADCRKYNALTLAGYRLLRFATCQVQSGEAIDTIRDALRTTDPPNPRRFSRNTQLRKISPPKRKPRR
jgi:very-short-patch-repair endonuclease